jgi:hypothetical protein
MSTKRDLEDYVQAIELFDKARVFHLLDLRAIQRLARHTSVSDIKHAYASTEKDLNKIAHHPTDSSTFRSRTWTGTISRLCGSVAGTILMIFFLLVSEFPSALAGSGLLILGISAVAICVIFFAVIMEYRLRKEFVKSYESLTLPAKRERIRKTTDLLIAKFAERLEKLERDPKDYRLALLHNDYGHLIVEKSKGGKFTAITAIRGRGQKIG